jgi:hypothetical protein
MRRLSRIEKCVDWEQPLHEIAIEATGLEDFGDSSYLDGLRVLLETYDTGCDLSDAGWYGAKHKLIHVLKQRLLSERAFKDRPQMLANPVERPIVITGLVRTGSTALHYLMAQDPHRQSLPYWLAEHPQPRPPREEWEAHPDFRASKTFLDLMFGVAPALRAVHFMAADWPEECGHLMAQTFTDDYWEAGMRAPHYAEWYEQADLVPTYTRHRKLIQTIGSSEPGKPWLLKYPVHMKHLRSFLEVYPDALVVWTHRDPASVMSSYASLIAGFRSLNVERVDSDDILREQMEIWASGAERAIEVRRQHPSEQFFDLHFRDFVADPVTSVQRIYQHFGIAWTPECEAALRAWHSDNPQHRHGKHEHSLDAVNVSREEMLERFSVYVDTFDVEVG